MEEGYEGGGGLRRTPRGVGRLGRDVNDDESVPFFACLPSAVLDVTRLASEVSNNTLPCEQCPVRIPQIRLVTTATLVTRNWQGLMKAESRVEATKGSSLRPGAGSARASISGPRHEDEAS